VEAHREKVVVALTSEEMARAIKSGKIALVIGLDTGNETAGDPLVLAELRRLGLRKMAMTHEAPTPFCGSNSSEPKTTPGLSPLGKTMVAECNRLGIMIDVSHCSDITFWGVLEVTRSPIIATHSGARGTPGLDRRNLSDEMLRALAKNGGMVGIGGATERRAYEQLEATGYYRDLARISQWMLQKYPDRAELADALRDPAKLAEARRSLGLPKGRHIAPLINPASTLRHLDYVANLIGFDHVGIGTDLEMYWHDFPPMVRGIAAGLIKGNYTQEQIGKIFHGNFLRLFRDNAAAV
jgi:membrane dipeptidase